MVTLPPKVFVMDWIKIVDKNSVDGSIPEENNLSLKKTMLLMLLLMLSCVDAVAINNVFEQTLRPLITIDNSPIVTSRGIFLTERMKLVKLQPYNFTGWIVQSIYTNDSMPCNGTLIHFNAVPLQQCLQDNSKSEGTYSFECSKGMLTQLLMSI